MPKFTLQLKFKPAGDQLWAIEKFTAGFSPTSIQTPLGINIPKGKMAVNQKSLMALISEIYKLFYFLKKFRNA